MESETLDTIYLDDRSRPQLAGIQLTTVAPIRVQEPATCTEGLCRICLEACPLHEKFCSCSGGLLTHQHCLIRFLNMKVQKQRLRLSELSCEICNRDYEVQIQPTCTFSLQQCKNKISSNHTRCAIYSFFFLFALLFYALMGFLFVTRPLSDVGRVVLIIVAVCIFLMFSLFLGVWLYEYLFKTEFEGINKVLSIEERRIKGLSRPAKVHPANASTQNLSS